jgi:parallel beta-helix repeat protein
MRSRHSAHLAVFVLGCALAALGPPPLAAGTAARMPGEVIEVFPGPNAIAHALASAEAGDLLNIHGGTYPEEVVVRVNAVTLTAAGDGQVTIDGGCSAGSTVSVRAPDVALVGLRVVGAGAGPFPIEIDFSGVESGTVRDTEVHDTCDAEYGVNVFDGGSIKIVRVTASGFSDAGIYVGAISSTPSGSLTVRSADTFGNSRGIIVENSSGGSIVVSGNRVHNNSMSGIYVTNSDRVSIRDNTVTNDNFSGIEVTFGSDMNLIARNTVSGHQFDLYDGGGIGNCWRNNVYTTSQGSIDY